MFSISNRLTIAEVDKSQDLQSESERLAGADAAVPARRLAAWRPRRGRKKLVSQVRDSQEGRIPSCAGDGPPFVVFRPAADWMQPAHTRENKLP